jgi:Rhodopirellula transposase DDE domain
MMNTLTIQTLSTIKLAAKKLSGSKRRAFQAQVTKEYLGGSGRRAERVFGWSRTTVEKGLRELETGIGCMDNFSARGRHRTEEKDPALEAAIRALVDPQSQTDPKFQSAFLYTRVTGEKVRQVLIEEKGYRDEELPHPRTFQRLLNRLNYRLRRVQKTKPLKKIPETEAIFEQVAKANRESDEREDSLRISIDSKAHLKIGELSRGGKSRGEKAPQAHDHDTQVKATLIPFGILEVTVAMLTIIFGVSRETADFIVDCLELWWQQRKTVYAHIRELVINLDNGPELASHRTQFIKRLVEFADRHDLTIQLVYYPPYHSKYNPVERCWGVLERHWNGTLLNTIETALRWAGTMTWKGGHPFIKLLEGVYEKGVRLSKKTMEVYEQRLERSNNLPKWNVVIRPQIA